MRCKFRGSFERWCHAADESVRAQQHVETAKRFLIEPRTLRVKANERLGLEARPGKALEIFYRPGAFASRSERALAAETTFPFCL
jgi:hypothetical protein